jgi:hypothetical protein
MRRQNEIELAGGVVVFAQQAKRIQSQWVGGIGSAHVLGC